MTTINALNLAEVGSLVGDVTRAQMLVALLDGRALTARGRSVTLTGVF